MIIIKILLYGVIVIRKEGINLNKLELNNTIFENIKHIDEDGNEYWSARELEKILGYSDWRNFKKVLMKSIDACNNSNVDMYEHIVEVNRVLSVGNNARLNVSDYKLSRYACYLIVQNSDPKKETVALGQTYFAVQTRRQELSEKDYNLLSEDEKRFYQRSLTKKGNYSLNQAAKNAGVRNFDRFHNYGYKGLYNGETADDIAKRKKLRYREDILDNMGSEELADNLFRIVHTEAKLKNDNIKGESNANIVHYEMGRDIRNFIASHGGTMPEELPTPEKSLKELEKLSK